MLNSDATNPETHRGVFTSGEQLDCYEKLWHFCVYKPSWNEMAEKVYTYLVCVCVCV